MSRAAPTREVLVTPSLPTPSDLELLQAVRDYPCVSLLLSTTPAPVMTAADATLLSGLLAQVEARLRAEPLGKESLELVGRLHELVSVACRGPSRHALAVYASPHHEAVFTFPVAVADRAVVDPTFATRDLVRALHRTPRHLVLALAGDEARLFRGGHGHDLAPVDDGFPLRLEAGNPSRPGRPHGRLRVPDRDRFFRGVDRALGDVRRDFPSPLVIVGGAAVVSAFLRVARSADRLAGVVPGGLIRAPLADLAERVRPVLEAYLLSREAEALAELEAATGADRTVSGVPQAWLGLQTARPEMLAVEEGLVFPARIAPDGDLVPAGDVTHPEVLDDAVDEIIEMVMQRGGWVAMVRDGRLAEHGGLALTLRAR